MLLSQILLSIVALFVGRPAWRSDNSVEFVANVSYD